MILGRKKIILLIIGLIALNLAFVFDIFYMQGAGAQQGYCGSREKVNIYPESAIITEHRGCDKNCQSVNRGRLLFKYYGENSDCQSSNIKGPQGERECYENFPFGGPGTLETGGNWVMSDARGFYFNGRDSSGYHWLQSGTQAEPMGTVMGFKTGLEDVFFGRSIVVDKDLRLKGRVDLAFGNYIDDQKRDYLVGSTRREIKEVSFNDNFHTLKGYISPGLGEVRGICGMSEEEEGGTCWSWTGSNHRTQLDGKTKVQSSLKIADNFYIPYYVDACLNCHCCAFDDNPQHAPAEYKKQDVKHYYGYEEDTLKEEFVGYYCNEDTDNNGCQVSPGEAWGMYFINVPGYADACHTQPNTHYKIVNYRYEEGAGIVGQVAVCPSENTYNSGGKVRRPDYTDSVQESGCEQCATTTVEGARTWGCP